MKLTVKNNDWHTKPVQIKDATYKTLRNGKCIPTASNMLRKAAKI